jgi:predicted negative regulator of RcsB-dependent stress response
VDELLTDQQQAEQVKGWLRQNGAFLLGGVLLGLAGLFGWNQWLRWQERQAEVASDLYETFVKDAQSGALDPALAKLKALEEVRASSPYVDQGRLLLARLYLDRNKPAEAIANLRQVVDAPAAPELGQIARLRLARVLAWQEKYAEALAVLPASGNGGFAPAFHEVRGDVYFAMGKRDEARSEYQQALNVDAAEPIIDRAFVTAKLDQVGGAPVAPTP